MHWPHRASSRRPRAFLNGAMPDVREFGMGEAVSRSSEPWPGGGCDGVTGRTSGGRYVIRSGFRRPGRRGIAIRRVCIGLGRLERAIGRTP